MSRDPIASLRVRVSAQDVHYAGGLVAGAYCMELFGDLATEASIVTDGHEGLLRAYEAVELLAPVRAGDFLEGRATLVRTGNTSRTLDLEIVKVIAAGQDGRATRLDPPLPVARGRATTVARTVAEVG